MNNRTTFGVGLLGLGLTLAFSSAGTFAQNNEPAPGGANNGNNGSRRIRLNPGGGGGADRARAIADELSLTGDQRQKFEAEMKDYQDKMRALRDEHDKRLAALLTPEQLEKYRASQQNRGFGGQGGPGGNRGGGFGGGRGGGFGRQDPQQMLQRMKTELNLTADQESQIGKILQDSQAKTDALRESMSGPNADREALRTQMQSIRRDRTDKISAVLNAEQRQKWQASQQNRRGQGGGGPRGGGGPNGGNGGNGANSL